MRRGETLPAVYEGFLRYMWRTITGQQQRQENLSDREAFGEFKDPKKWKSRCTTRLNEWLAAHGVTREDLNIINEEQGHISNERGEMVPYTASAAPFGRTILLVEKLHIAAPLATALAAEGITVVDTKGHARHRHRKDAARWIAEGRKVLVMTDDDFAGAEIADELAMSGVDRLRLDEFEAIGGEVPEAAVEFDHSYTRQESPHTRISAEDHARLLRRGARVGITGPCRVELDGALVAWGEARFTELVKGALGKRGLLAPPPSPPLPQKQQAPPGRWWD